MSYFARLLRYLFWLLVVSWTTSILRRLVLEMGEGRPGHPDLNVTDNAVTQKLVRDPVCGMHIAEGLGLPLKQGGETLFFCSAECREKYRSDREKFAANA
jgi:YHS domain-containing protein